MPKELYEINRFITGTIANVADRDISDDAASYSKNVDPTSVSGKLKSIADDAEIKDGAGSPVSLGNGVEHGFINNNGKRDLVWYTPSTKLIKHVTDLYGTKGTITASSAVTSSVDKATMEPNNRELHVGLGNGASDEPKWVGYVPHGQFGDAAPAAIQVTKAELLSPTIFPAMYSICQDDTYIYGVEYEGQFIYRFKKSDGTLDKTSTTRMTGTTAIALAGDVANYGKTYDAGSGVYNDLWVFDKDASTYGTLYRVDRNTLGIVQESPLTAGSGAAHVSSIVESTAKLWFGYHAGGALTSGILYNIATPTSDGNITLVNASPWEGASATNPTLPKDGHYFDAAAGVVGSGTSGTTCKFYTTRDSLSLTSDNLAEVVYLVRQTASDDGTLYVQYMYDEDFEGGGERIAFSYPLTQAAWIIKEAYAHVSEPASTTVSSKAYPVNLLTGSSPLMAATDQMLSMVQAKDVSGFVNKAYITYHTTANQDAVFIGKFPLFAQHSTSGTISIFSSVVTGQLNNISATHKKTIPEGDVYEGLITGQRTGAGENILNVLSGGSFGSWYAIDGDNSFGNAAYTLRSNYEASVGTSGANTEWSASNTYFYATSFLYDGYQESPLSTYKRDNSQVQQNRTITLKLFNLSGSSSPLVLSPRISHINLYRAEMSGNATQPGTYFRLIKSSKLDASWSRKSNNWGAYRQLAIVDDYINGASYEASSGLPETIDRTLPHYGVSTQLNNEMFIGQCFHRDIENTENYIFKSLPYRYDMYDWTADLLRIPSTVTALAAFSGKVYAFDESRIFRINPQGMYVEDILEGIGCASQSSVLVNDYGMCFADRNNIYLHNGRSPEPIGQAILTDESGAGNGWLERDRAQDPLVLFDGAKQSFAVFFKKTGAATYGSELITNGTFDSVTTGWSPNLRVVLSINSAKLRLTSNAVSGNAIAYQSFTAVPGRTYRVTANFIAGDDQGAKISVGDGDALTSGVYQGGSAAMTTNTAVDFTFVAIDTTQVVYLYQVETDDAENEYHEWDNVSIKEQQSEFMAWSYNVPRKRWDLWDVDSDYKGGIVGKNSEILLNTGSVLKSYTGGTSQRAWEFSTKNITMNMDTQEKIFYKINTIGDATSKVSYSVDGGSYTTPTAGNSLAVSSVDKKKKAIKIKVESTQVADIVDSIGLVYRRLKIK